MEFKDYYDVLGLERTATQDEVKRAYRKLARKFHPDINKDQDAEAKFKDIGEAYEVLKDPEKRAAYDQLGANWETGQQFKPPPDWNAGFEYSNEGFTHHDSAAFSDFFETLFGGGGSSGFHTSRQFHARGEDHYAKVFITLADAYNGTTRKVKLKAPHVDDTGHVTLSERTLNVKIPKGVTEGQHIRLSGQGSPGIGQGPGGDLYLEVHFQTDSLYRIDGRDVYLDVPLAPWEAALGAKIKIPTPSGSVALKTPAGASAGKKLRLKGKGIPGNPTGDFYAVLQISLPPADNDEAKKIYEDMAEKLDFDPRVKMGV